MIFDAIKLGFEVVKHLFPDPKQRAEAERKLLQLQRDGQLKTIEIQLSAIIAEAQSSDPWTSRARPGFLWTMYVLILFAIPMGVLNVFSPESAGAVAEGFQAWLTAIPESFVTLFGVGYLGYTGARSYQEVKRTKPQ